MYLPWYRGDVISLMEKREIKMITRDRRTLRSWLPAWSMELFFLTLLLIGGLGVIGSLIANLSFCPEGPSEDFWAGCAAELLGFAWVGPL